MNHPLNQLSPFRSVKCCRIGIVAILFAAASAQGQESESPFSPGSVFHRASHSILTNEESDAFELEDWVPPATNYPQSTASDWVPPNTNSKPSFPLRNADSESLVDDALIIEPPIDDPASALPAVDPTYVPQSGSTLVPFSDIEQSGRAAGDAYSSETPPAADAAAAPTIDGSPEALAVDASPEVPPNAEMTGDELIEFDSDCLECDQAEGLAFETGATSACDCGAADCDACGIGRQQIGSRAAAVGRGAVGRTLNAGKNVLSRAHNIGGNQQGQPRLFTPVRNVLGRVNQGLAGNQAVHAVGQISFLSFARDYRGRGRQLASGVPNLFANGPDEGVFTGVDLSYGRRRSGGRGWEMRYIGFDPGVASDVSGSTNLVWGGFAPPLNDPATFGGALNPNIPQTFGLSGIGLNGVSVADVFNSATSHRVTRDSQFGSFEFNVLRATAGSTLASSGDSVVELFAGLRGVSFQETTTFSAGGVSIAGFPNSALYASEVQNSLFGLQIGGRLERGLGSGWGFTFGSRVGIYNNRVESRQRSQFTDFDGSVSTPVLFYGDDAGSAFDFEGKDNELAFLGELDFGVTYQFRQFTRAKFGFRGIAVTNVANAAGQFEDSLYDVDVISKPQAFGDLLVGGFYFGVDHAF